MDKARRKELLRAHKAATHESARKTLGLTESELTALRDTLDAAAEHLRCDHTVRITREWATSRGLDPNTVSAGVREFGGFCDCEVLANVEPEKFGWR
jgi:Protein of unknown function (DUF2695)